MAIAASHIVSVNPRVQSGAVSDLEMNGLLFSRNQLISAKQMVLGFRSAKEVKDYFGLDSKEYAAASIYFNAYDRKFTAPRSLYIARRVDEDLSAWLMGGAIALDIAEFKKIVDGSLKIKIDQNVIEAVEINFAQCSTFSEMASVIESALNKSLSDVKVSYNSFKSSFLIVSPTKGDNSSISFALESSVGTDLSGPLRLGKNSSVIISDGLNALSINAQMDAVCSKSDNWVSFTTLWEASTEEILLWGEWANRHYGWLYQAWTENKETPAANSLGDPASRLRDNGYDHCSIVYGSVDYAMFIMGSVAAIPWLRKNGSITLAFKRQSGLAATVNDDLTASVLEKKNCNYFGNFATRNASFTFLYPSCLSSSDYGFIDPYINAVWLNNRIQAALLHGLTQVGRVPYNERGYTMIRAWLMDPVNAALLNSSIEPGVKISESQKSELIAEAGHDISNELWSHGYYIQILDPGAEARSRRESPIVSLWYTYGGAVQRIEIAATAVI